ncbi:hypothetical protein T12_16503 [Trichinella patagoniensis]|uniref:Uncharacterized protein n=1 Tax=Trichinella patagoniensis TaxID=990121 RepID=A0A0V0ZN08_9BILA|nr:hypothetical protein T12_16503 [Trichinella patagoniensis]
MFTRKNVTLTSQLTNQPQATVADSDYQARAKEAATDTYHVIERGDLVRTHGNVLQYHTDEKVRGVMRAMHVQVSDVYDGLKSALFEAFGVRTGSESVWVYAGHLRWLFLKAFRGLSGAADKILLQQFKAGLSVNAVKTAVLRSRTDSFAEAIESKQALTRKTCSQPSRSQDHEKFMWGSKTLWDVPKPAIQLETASGGELQVTNACVTEIIHGGLMTVWHIVLCVKGLSHKILFGRATFRLGSLTLFPQSERNHRITHSMTLFHAQLFNVKKAPDCTAHSQPPMNAGINPNRVRRRTVHVRFGPQGDEREAPHHSHRRRQASAVLRKADRPPPANAGGIPPDRNVEARRCGAVELSSPIVLVKKKDGSCRFFVDYQQLNNLTQKYAHQCRP